MTKPQYTDKELHTRDLKYKPSRINKLMKYHGVKCKVLFGKAWIQNTYTLKGKLFSEWVNATNWTEYKLYTWLGY